MTTLTTFLQRLRALAADRRGQDLVEYAMLVGFIGVAVGAVFPTTIAPDISTIFSKIESCLNWSNTQSL
jgi:Flp pilus assembly pilin Flp